MIKLRFVLSAFLISFMLHAQENITSEKCGSDALHQMLWEQDEAYRTAIEANEQLIKQLIEENPGFRNENNVLTIPVVVHVIHLGEPVGTGNNISDAQILGAIQGLNDRFRNANGLGVNFHMEFCLAVRDPNNQPTNGIIRVDGSGVPDYADNGINFGSDQCGGNETAVKNLSRWPVSQYYNIWVVNRICGGWAGYAYYPWGGNNDGTVMARNSMTQNSITLAHELGHGFNLRHTFDGDGSNANCPPDDSCIDQGDRVCDTPPHKTNDCGGTNPCPDSGIWDNSRRNFMSYCGTRNRFTAGQRERARAAAVMSPRLSLLTSLGCIPVSDNDALLFEISNPTKINNKLNCSIDTIHPVIRFRNIGLSNLTSLTFVYQANSGEEQSFIWQGNLAPGAYGRATLAPLQIELGDNTFQCRLELPNGQIDPTPENNERSIDFSFLNNHIIDENNVVETGPATCPNTNDGLIYYEINRRVHITEDFENGADGWVLVNGAQPNRWTIGEATAASGNKSIYISNNSGADNNYDNGRSSVVHFYKDFYIPPHASNLRVTYDWRNAGETNQDFISVRAVFSTIIPAAGYSMAQAALVGSNLLANQAMFNNNFSNLISFNPGNTLRLVFSWNNNSNGQGNQPPAALDNITLSYNINPAVDFNWSNGENASIIFSLSPDIYTVQINDLLGCEWFDTLEVGILNQQDIEIIALSETSFCEGESVILAFNGEQEVNWSNGLTAAQIEVTNSGIFTASVSEGICEYTSNALEVNVISPPPAPLITQTDNILSSNATANSYQWFFNGSPIPGATSPEHIAENDGLYALEITNNQGCSSMSDALNVQLSSISVADNFNFQIFPNPGKGIFQIKGHTSAQSIQVNLINAAGKTIDQRIIQDAVLDYSHINAGLYFVQLISHEKVGLMKLIIAE